MEIHAMQRIASITFRLGLTVMVFIVGLLAFLTTTTIENRIQIRALQLQAGETHDRVESLGLIRVDLAEIREQLRQIQGQLDLVQTPSKR